MTGARRSLSCDCRCGARDLRGLRCYSWVRLAYSSTSTMTPIPTTAEYALAQVQRVEPWVGAVCQDGWLSPSTGFRHLLAPTAAYACGQQTSEDSPQSLGSPRAGAPLRLSGTLAVAGALLVLPAVSDRPVATATATSAVAFGCTGPCRERCPSVNVPSCRRLLGKCCHSAATLPRRGGICVQGSTGARLPCSGEVHSHPVICAQAHFPIYEHERIDAANQRKPVWNTPRMCKRRGPVNSHRVEIVAPERTVSVGILRGHHRYEFQHRLRMKLSCARAAGSPVTALPGGVGWTVHVRAVQLCARIR